MLNNEDLFRLKKYVRVKKIMNEIIFFKKLLDQDLESIFIQDCLKEVSFSIMNYATE